MKSTFDGSEWTTPLVIGPKGSMFGSFVRSEPLWLVFRRAVPLGWGAIELDDVGNVVRQTAVASSVGRPPRLVEVSHDSVAFSWSGDNVVSAAWSSSLE